MCGRIGEWADDFQLLDDGAGPPVGDDERQRIFMFRTNVNEMNIQPIDFGDEIRQGVQLGLDLAPIILGRPIAGECLRRCQLHALGRIGNGFPIRPFCCVYSPAQFGKFRFRDIHMKRSDCIVVSYRLGALQRRRWFGS